MRCKLIIRKITSAIVKLIIFFCKVWKLKKENSINIGRECRLMKVSTFFSGPEKWRRNTKRKLKRNLTFFSFRFVFETRLPRKDNFNDVLYNDWRASVIREKLLVRFVLTTRQSVFGSPPAPFLLPGLKHELKNETVRPFPLGRNIQSSQSRESGRNIWAESCSRPVREKICYTVYEFNLIKNFFFFLTKWSVSFFKTPERFYAIDVCSLVKI